MVFVSRSDMAKLAKERAKAVKAYIQSQIGQDDKASSKAADIASLAETTADGIIRYTGVQCSIDTFFEGLHCRDDQKGYPDHTWRKPVLRPKSKTKGGRLPKGREDFVRSVDTRLDGQGALFAAGRANAKRVKENEIVVDEWVYCVRYVTMKAYREYFRCREDAQASYDSLASAYAIHDLRILRQGDRHAVRYDMFVGHHATFDSESNAVYAESVLMGEVYRIKRVQSDTDYARIGSANKIRIRGL